MLYVMRSWCVFSFVLIALGPAAAEPRFEFWPGATYNPAIPTLRKVVGHDPGERISSPAQIIQYFEALAAAAPARMKLIDYGKSWEGRRLFYAVIGSEANLRRLEEIRAGIERLSDPRRTAEPEARKLTATLPATLWLAYVTGAVGGGFASHRWGLPALALPVALLVALVAAELMRPLTADGA